MNLVRQQLCNPQMYSAHVLVHLPTAAAAVTTRTPLLQSAGNGCRATTSLDDSMHMHQLSLDINGVARMRSPCHSFRRPSPSTTPSRASSRDSPVSTGHIPRTRGKYRNVMTINQEGRACPMFQSNPHLLGPKRSSARDG